MGSAMNRWRVGAAAALTAALLVSVTGGGFGVGFGVSGYPLDLAPALSQVTGAVSASLSSLGVSSTDAAGILGEIDGALAEVRATLPVSSFPVPLLSFAVDVPVPFVVVDDLRFSGGFLSDGLVRGVADAFGASLPDPLFSAEFALGGTTGGVTIDPSFRTIRLSTEALKQFDLFLLALDLGAGIDYVQGTIDPGVTVQAPSDQRAAVAAVLDALHLDGLHWSSFALHGQVAIEIGPPFLRTVVGAVGFLPLSQTTGWWGLGVGQWSVSLGWEIRF